MKTHLARDNHSVLCGRSRVGIETLCGKLKRWMVGHPDFCKRCQAMYRAIPARDRYINRG